MPDLIDKCAADNKLKICLFFTFGMSLKKWHESGLLNREVQLYKELVKNDVLIKFVTYGDASDLDYLKVDNIQVIPIYTDNNIPTSRFVLLLSSLNASIKLIKKIRDCDILKTNQMLGAWLPLVLHWFTRKPFIVRCGYEHYKTGLLEKKSIAWKFLTYIYSFLVYKNADKIILTSNEDKEFVKNKFKINERKINVIPNYIDTDKFKPNHDIKKINTNRLLYIGRLSKEKNISSAILACGVSKVGLDIVGQGELLDYLLKQSKDNAVDVRFLGKKSNDDLPALINEYDIVILPSLYEGCPKSLLEAMSCGKATIGSDVAGIKEIIQHKETGYITKKDYLSISKSIDFLLCNKELTINMGLAAREYIQKKHSIESYVHDELEVYSEFINA